ncbi:hypothetical protein Tco_1026285 [Tanacetum coccineum]
MASLDHRLNPLFSIKECSSCRALYTADFCCSKWGASLKKLQILVPKPPQNCSTCGDPVDGLYCRPCAFVRKCLNEVLWEWMLYWFVIVPPDASTMFISNPELMQSTTTDALSKNFFASFDPSAILRKRNSLPYTLKPNFVDNSPNVFNPPPQPPMYSCEFCGNYARYGHYCEKIDDEYERDCEIKIKQLLQDYSGLDIEMRKKERVLMEEKYLAASQRIKSICNDEDDSIPLRDIIARYSPSVAITSSPPVLPTREPEDSLIMGDEHLDTIPEKESDELIKSSVENLVPIPSESEDFSDNESECDETSPIFTTFSNPLFDSNDDFTSSDDESLSDEDVPMENFKIYSNPLFDDEEIISPKIDPHYFNAESNHIKYLLNRDILIHSSPKFDYLLEEFSGELAHINPIPPGIEKADFDLEEEIRLVEYLLYDNSSPRPPEELNLEITEMILESLSPYPILVADSDSLMEEIDLFLASDDSMPPGIEDDDYDSEEDIRFLEELLNNDSLSLPEKESSILDHFNDPSPSRPPPEPPDVEICFDFKPDTGVVTNKVVGDISKHDVLMPNLLPTQPTLCPVFDLLLLFSSENEDKVFNPGILISPLLSHWGEITSNFYKSPMMIHGGDIPHLDVSFLHFYPP